MVASRLTGGIDLRFARGILPLFIAALVQFFPQLLWACPMCDTSTADQVRAGLVTTSLDGLTIPGLILPFLALALVIGAIHTDWSEFLIEKNVNDNLTSHGTELT